MRVFELIGNTPVVELQTLSKPAGANILVKLEAYNPGGSIKDRIALSMIESAERRGVLSPGMTVIEPTSGNTGIGLALVCACKDYKLQLVMPENMSEERRRLFKAFGADFILTDAVHGMRGAVQRAEEIAGADDGYYMPQQFLNPDNPRIHQETTAVEILQQVENPSALVAGVGTGGTITGLGRFFKLELKREIKLVAVEPASSPVLSGGSPGSHNIPGIGAGFVPSVLERHLIDAVCQVRDKEAEEMCRYLAQQEGILVGLSSGAAIYAAQKIAVEMEIKGNIVVIAADSGERYLSKVLFS